MHRVASDLRIEGRWYAAVRMQARRYGGLVAAALVITAAVTDGCVGDEPTTSPQPVGDDAAATVDGGETGALEDAAVDTGNADAGGFCATHGPGAVFCEDFDGEPLAARGWLDRSTPGSAVTLVASERSPPYALNARSAAVTDAGVAHARIEHAIPLPATFQRLKISADIRFPVRATPLVPAHGFQLTAGDFRVALHDNGAPQPSTRQLVVFGTKPDGGGNLQITEFEEHPSGWARYEIDLERTDGGLLAVLASRDGQPMKPAGGGSPGMRIVGAALGSQGASLEIGSWSNANNGEAVHEIDNVLITVE